MFKSFVLIILLSLFFLISCDKSEHIVDGLKPNYVSKSKAFDIYSTPPSVLQKPGKIYLYNSLVFINEIGKGVHVVDNSNSSQPLITHFINIPGNYDIAIKNNFLYADNITDLVTIDISDLNNVQEVARIKNAYQFKFQFYPPQYTGYFECVDTANGYVISWESATLEDPKCNR